MKKWMGLNMFVSTTEDISWNWLDSSDQHNIQQLDKHESIEKRLLEGYSLANLSVHDMPIYSVSPLFVYFVVLLVCCVIKAYTKSSD